MHGINKQVRVNEKVEQKAHMPEQVNKQERQFKQIRNDQKQWHGVHVP